MTEPLDPRRSDDPAPPAPAPWTGPQAQPEGEPATNVFPAPAPGAPSYQPPSYQPPSYPEPSYQPASYPPPSYQPPQYGPPAYPPVSGMPASGAPTAYPADPYGAPVSGTAQLPSVYQPGYQAPLPVPYPPAPASYPPPMYQAAGFGYDPVSGQPYSDKSKVIAGLLQLLPAIFFSLGGIGRLYAGNTTLGVLQIAATVVGWICFWCGIVANVLVLFLPLLVYGGIWLWFVVDAIILFAGRPVDGQGRPLRS